MKNYKIVIQYDGTRYNGWQRQGNTKNTIQERFENVLSLMSGETVEIYASGRTDAGVHAAGQVANFKCNTNLSELEIQNYLNHYLPSDIAVLSIEEVHDRFHSRLNAVSKTYTYRIATHKPDVFFRKYVYFSAQTPDVSKMRQASELLLGTHDFRGFSSVGKTKKSTVRTIHYIDITEKSGVIEIKINGNGFLHNMVRIICGTLYDIGINKMQISDISKIFETKTRINAGTTLPPEGLMLTEVFY